MVDQQILAALNRTPEPKVEIYAENLDTVRFPAERSQRIFAEYLAEKYADYPPDLIMLVFVGSVAPPGKILSELFPATPVIVAGLTEEVLREDEFGSSVGGFAQRTDPEATLRVILRLQPSLERLVIVAGTAEIDRQLLRRVESAAHGLKGKLDIQIWNNVRVSELRERSTHLPPRSAILFTRMFQDGAGQATISAQVGRWLSEWANAPVYVLSDGAFGTGAVGGSVASIEAFGQRAGELARRTLTGAAEEALRFEVLTATVPMVERIHCARRW